MSVSRFNAIEGRLTKLETTMNNVAAQYDTLKGEVQTAVDNTAEILTIMTGVKKVGGIAAKHWKTAIVFGAGIMTSAGIGNPEVLGFIRSFFGAV